MDCFPASSTSFPICKNRWLERWSLRTTWVLIFGNKFHMADTCLQCLPPSLHAHPWLSLLGNLLSECGVGEEGSGLQESLIAAYAGCLATPTPTHPASLVCVSWSGTAHTGLATAEPLSWAPARSSQSMGRNVWAAVPSSARSQKRF